MREFHFLLLNHLFVFVQTDLIKIHLKYHLLKCVLDSLPTAPLNQYKYSWKLITLQRENDATVDVRSHQSPACFALISFTSQCQKTATLNRQSSRQSFRRQPLSVETENSLGTKPSPSAPLVVYSKLSSSHLAVVAQPAPPSEPAV